MTLAFSSISAASISGGSGTDTVPVQVEYLADEAAATQLLAAAMRAALTDSATATQALDFSYIHQLFDTASADEGLTSLLAKVMTDQATATAVLAATGAYVRSLVDEAEASESLRAALLAVVGDDATAAETFDAVLRYYGELRDRVLAEDTLATSLTASNLLFTSALASDLIANAFSAHLTDSAQAASLLVSSVAALGQLIDSAEAQVTAGNTLRMLGYLSDASDATTDITSVAQLLGALSSGASAAVVLSIGGEEYTAWVLNTENIAVTQYTNYPFNSYAELNNRYYGASEDGIYRLTGADDAGAAIQAYFRAPLTDFGLASLKRAPQFYIGYTADGELLLKVVVVSPNGVKEEHWHRLEARTAGGVRETRTKLGKGLQSVYWQYEIHNINGADFQMETVRMWPMVLTRRVR